jgi:hypothetical protein
MDGPNRPASIQKTLANARTRPNAHQRSSLADPTPSVKPTASLQINRNVSLYNDAMTVLIDRPTWPAHGTTWSHLVSDFSLDELHAFARRHGIPPRSFDRDHYDVPAERYDSLVAAGAVPVTNRELVTRLRDSGLRITARQRRGL